MTLVVDASAVAEILLGTEQGRRSAAVVALHDHLLAPELLAVEVVSVMRGLARSGQHSVARLAVALDDFNALGIELHPLAPLMPRLWELRDRVSAYDATYVALAEALDCQLLTGDARLARAVGARATLAVGWS